MVPFSWGKMKGKKPLLSTVLGMVLVVALFGSEISTSGRFPSIQIQAK